MIEIRAEPIKDLATLQRALQDAIKLEHATIPPYLLAYYTLKGTSDSVKYARGLIRGIVNQEMLHMALACNILNAINCAPQINVPGFIPTYPGHLPMGIEESLIVHLKRYSRGLVEQTFLVIEEPENPLKLPVKPLFLAPTEIRTIGQYYASIRAEIKRQGNGIFTGKREKQVKDAQLGAIEVFDVDSAVTAITIIIEQGEGTALSPAGMNNMVAHFYRFQELSMGMKIVPDAPSPFKFSFDPRSPIKIDDQADVIQMVDDPQIVKYEAEDAAAAKLADKCDAVYSSILKTLHDAFNGQPARIDDAIDQMRNDFGPAIKEVLGVQITGGPNKGLFAGPRFKFAPPELLYTSFI